jgi:hypothetical protein
LFTFNLFEGIISNPENSQQFVTIRFRRKNSEISAQISSHTSVFLGSILKKIEGDSVNIKFPLIPKPLTGENTREINNDIASMPPPGFSNEFFLNTYWFNSTHPNRAKKSLSIP